MRLHLEAPGKWKVVDDEGVAARGHLEVPFVPLGAGEAAPILFVADWTRDESER